MTNKRGVYELFITFFLVLVLVFGVTFVLFAVVSSTGLYAQVQQASQAPLDALALKDAVMLCHRTDYLDERLIDNPCPAKNMLNGFKIRQLAINGCEEQIWDYSRPGHTQTTPFVTTIEKEGAGKKCLAILEVLSGENA